MINISMEALAQLKILSDMRNNSKAQVDKAAVQQTKITEQPDMIDQLISNPILMGLVSYFIGSKIFGNDVKESSRKETKYVPPKVRTVRTFRQ
jgi:hypothetical protein